MDVLIHSQSFSSMAYITSGGAEVMGPGEEYESELDTAFFDWLRRSGKHWTITTVTGGDSIVISHWNEVYVETQRTTITCDRGDYDEALRQLKELHASLQRREREQADSSLLVVS